MKRWLVIVLASATAVVATILTEEFVYFYLFVFIFIFVSVFSIVFGIVKVLKGDKKNGAVVLFFTAVLLVAILLSVYFWLILQTASVGDW